MRFSEAVDALRTTHMSHAADGTIGFIQSKKVGSNDIPLSTTSSGLRCGF